MKSQLPLILGMAAVTYLPRLLPLLALSDRALPPLAKRFFLYIPYTALGALITRGVLEAPDTLATLAAIGMAAICSWLRGGLITSVAAAIIAALLISSR